MSCPFLYIFTEKKHTGIVCKNREAMPAGSGYNARVIRKQPKDHVIADVEIPEWCPLPDSP